MSLSALRRMHARFGVDLDRGPLPLLSAAPHRRTGAIQPGIPAAIDARRRASDGWRVSITSASRSGTTRPSSSMAAAIRRGSAAGSSRPCSRSGKASSYAAYGQGTLPIGQATDLTLGLRYTIEHRSVEANGERLFDNPPFVRPIPGLPLLTEEPLRRQQDVRRADMARFAGPAFLRSK